MKGEYESKSVAKLLAVTMVFALAFVAVGAIVTCDIDADGETTAKTMTGEDFLKQAESGVLTLTEDVTLTSTVNVGTSLTLDLAGHSITTKALIDVFWVTADRVDLTIKDTSANKTGSITTTGEGSSVVYVATYKNAKGEAVDYKPGNLSITGGTYSGGYTIIWKGNGSAETCTNTVVVKDATINADTAGLWLSFSAIKSAEVDNVKIDSKNIGIYFAKCQTATLNNSIVSAIAGSAVEIKDGNVSIQGCELSCKTYEDSDSVGYSQSGGAVSVITVNNAYAEKDITVVIDAVANGKKSVLTPVSGKSPIVITDDCVKKNVNAETKVETWSVVGTKNITFTWAQHDSDVKVVYLKNTSNGKITDDKAYIGVITVNEKKYVADIIRATDSFYLLNDLTFNADTSFTQAILNGYKLIFKGSADITISGKITGAPTIVDKDTVVENFAMLNDYTVKNGNVMTFSSGSIVIQETGEVVAPSATGDITITGTAKIVGDTVINGEIKLDDGAKLSVPDNTTLTVNKISSTGKSTVVVDGNLDVKTDLDNVKENEAGVNVKVSSGASVSGVKNEGNIAYTSPEKEFEFGDTLNSDYTVTRSEHLSTTLTIPSGVTLTIASTGILNLAANDIIVYGNLVVENGGVIAATTGTEKIVLMKGFSFQCDGILGQGSQAVTVTAVQTTDTKYTGEGSVKMKNVTGLSFELANTTTSTTAKYTLVVNGNMISDKNKDSDVSTVEFNGVRITGETTVGEDVILTSTSATLMGSATLTVDGEMVATSFIMKNKSTMINNGIVTGIITAQTANYKTSEGYSAGETKVTVPTANEAEGKKSGITGFTLAVNTVPGTEYNADGTSVAMTYQRLYISGDLDWVFNKGENPTVATGEETLGFDKDVYVGGETTLTVQDGMKLSMTSGNIIVLGKIVMDGSDATSGKYTGTMYIVKTTSPKTTTVYVEPFAAAIANIDSADKKTVTVQEGVKISGELNIAAGQIVKISSGKFKVSETGVMTVAEKGKIDGTIDDVQGILKVMKGAACGEPASYASKTVGTDYVQYSGIAVALANANAGDVIEISKNTSVENDLVIPKGVTVKVKDGAEIKVGGNVKVEETAKIILADNSKITMTGDKSKVTVNGEINAVDGTVAGMKSIESAGKTVLSSTNFESIKSVVNAFVYVDDDNNAVLTDAQTAIDADAAKDIPKGVNAYGTVNGGDVELKTNMVINENAKVTFGNITVADGKKIDMTKGETTGTITAKTGVSGSETDSSVSVSKVSGIVIGAGSNVDDQNVKTFVLYIYGTVKGGVEIAQGTAVVGYSADKTLTVTGAGNTVSVKSGATLQVNDGMTFNIGSGTNMKASVTVDGTLSADTNGIISIGYASTNGSIVINGTLSVADKNDDKVVIVAGSKIVINGTVAVSTTEEKEGKLVLNGTMYIGKASETLGANGVVSGAVAIGDSAYIVAYAGSDVSAAKFNWNDAENKSGAVSTQVLINGSELLTAYAKTKGTIDIIGNIVTDDLEIKGLNLDGIEEVAKWSSDAAKQVAITNKIGSNKAIYFDAPAAKVDGTISAGVGLKLFLNGVSVENYYTGEGYRVSVGQYKVSFEVQTGYDGSNAVVTFNGQTVSNNGMITFADDGFVLTATGAVPSSGTVVIDNEKDDGMSLTDILLIVLVVLIAVMAIMVALRMMRS